MSNYIHAATPILEPMGLFPPTGIVDVIKLGAIAYFGMIALGIGVYSAKKSRMRSRMYAKARRRR